MLLNEREEMKRNFRKLLYIGFAVLLLLAAVSRCHAQSTGTIRGTVSDPSGAAIPNATVTATSTATSISRIERKRHLCPSQPARRRLQLED